MNPKVVGAISGSMGGALLGAVTGWLIDKGTGAGYGAILGGAASGFVGYAVAPTASTTPAPAGTGALPRRMAQINDQLMPRRVGAGAVIMNARTPPDVSGQPISPHPGFCVIVHAAGPGGNPPAWSQYIPGPC